MGAEQDAVIPIEKYQENPWYEPVVAFTFGVFAVVFFTLFGGALEESTNIVDVSGNMITTARMASIGLGTGYYLGASLKNQSSGRSWFFLGVFATLTQVSAWTTDLIIFGSVPSYFLLIVGGVLSILAHLTPFVSESEFYMEWFKILSGYGTTAVVIFLGILDYFLTLVFGFIHEFNSLPTEDKIFSTAFIFIIGVLVVKLIVEIAKEV